MRQYPLKKRQGAGRRLFSPLFYKFPLGGQLGEKRAAAIILDHFVEKERVCLLAESRGFGIRLLVRYLGVVGNKFLYHLARFS